MWQAAENVAELVSDGGKLYIAIYNDQGWVSRYWHAVKRLYVKRPLLRFPIIAAHTPYPFFPALVSRTLAGGVRRDRGMSFSRDIIDWLGGLPFEVATPDAIVRFYEQRGFRLDRVVTTRRHGCNEFVFEKSQS
jgi:2-polyprenyl-6-hydroxyphenyl methylase/3-demethylubiquinone-9 3-methyltransferase